MNGWKVYEEMLSPQQYSIFQQVTDCFENGPDVCWLVVSDSHPIDMYDTFDEAKRVHTTSWIFPVSYQKNDSTDEDFNAYARTYSKILDNVSGARCHRVGWASVLFFFITKHESILVRRPTLYNAIKKKYIEIKSYLDTKTYSSDTIKTTMPKFIDRMDIILHKIPTHSYNLRSRK